MRRVNISLRQLIQIAYDPKLKNRVTGGLNWLDSERYDLDAGAGAAAGESQVRVMMQALLREGSSAKFRREIKELPVYSVVLEKERCQWWT